MSTKRLEKLSKLRKHPDNPRLIKGDKYKLLINSIIEDPDFLEKRPLIVNKDLVVIGGNMRLEACRELGWKETWIDESDWTEEKQRRFLIKDNSNFGEWDYDTLANEWEIEDLENWNVSIPSIKNTELLSGLEYDPIYYEPKEKPDITLKSCLDLEKFESKIKALDEYKLTDDQKSLLKFFAYRFIKIDFENVANYYSFNASEEEQKAIERLRLVLTDNGVKGFIEDDLLKIMGFTDQEFKAI
tara:strand:+ start:1804 stop:2532 length:729 start_codon:yes stop_codon:yes gene_type:complete